MQESAKNENWATHLCSEIGYILDDPIYFAQSNDFDPFDFWNSYYSIPNVDINNLYDYLNLAALIKSFFAPPKPMSFQLKNRWNQLNDDRLNIVVKLYPSTKKLINLFKNFTDQTHTAFSDCINFNDISVETELKQAINMISTARNRIEVELHRQGNYYNIYHGTICIGCLSKGSDISKTAELNHVSRLRGFRVSDICIWTYEETLKAAAMGKDFRHLWCERAKRKGFIYIVQISGFGEPY